ncbi:hypothetical protein T484DRAFT_1750455 [Baffinella frigidus]|nr:hypothetical protein T484DRAFT_1750455 [Cryptophyta sp. CCMP2293]
MMLPAGVTVAVEAGVGVVARRVRVAGVRPVIALIFTALRNIGERRHVDISTSCAGVGVTRAEVLPALNVVEAVGTIEWPQRNQKRLTRRLFSSDPPRRIKTRKDLGRCPCSSPQPHLRHVARNTLIFHPKSIIVVRKNTLRVSILQILILPQNHAPAVPGSFAGANLFDRCPKDQPVFVEREDALVLSRGVLACHSNVVPNAISHFVISSRGCDRTPELVIVEAHFSRRPFPDKNFIPKNRVGVGIAEQHRLKTVFQLHPQLNGEVAGVEAESDVTAPEEFVVTKNAVACDHDKV